MRSHFLHRLNVRGREMVLDVEPDFDFYDASRVLKFEVDYGWGEERLPSARLVLGYAREARRYEVGLLFEGIVQLVIPEGTPWLFLPELEVEDVQGSGMEGVGYEVISHYERSFRCLCRDIAVQYFRPSD